MEDWLLWLLLLIGVLLALATLERVTTLLDRRCVTKAHEGWIGSLSALAIWSISDYVEFQLGPAALHAALAEETSLAAGLVMMLVALWIILPGYLLGLIGAAWYRQRHPRSTEQVR